MEQEEKVLCTYEEGKFKYLVSAVELDEKSAMISFLKRVSGGKGRLPKNKVVNKVALIALVNSSSLWEAMLKNV